MYKKEPQPLSHTIYKNELKVDHRPVIRAKIIKCLRRKYRTSQ